MPDVLIVPTGTANTASVAAAFERLGARPRLCDDSRRLSDRTPVVLPGVGTFGAAARQLDELGLRTPLRDRVDAGRPTLAICVGMQLLCATSEESPEVRGLAVVDAQIRRFSTAVRVPQVGWNHITPVGGELLEGGVGYFANTYRLPELPTGWAGATTDYGGEFVSALERGGVLACQFHPEISGEFGERLLRRWLGRALAGC